ncbi:DMT family transporter [Streptomyces sp. NPDC016309]|uniref:DMT family transporter n=1 Tax=Streptomyces sp. NPDC016309 TaxID=3364965 RepID=UPI0037002B64
MTSLALSVLLSLASAVAYAAGAIAQERVAAAAVPAASSATWWAAVALNGGGAALHVVALAYGPLSLVQPLGASTVVFALPLAALLAGRRAGAAAWRGAVMATGGLAGLLALAGSGGGRPLDGGDRPVLVVAVTGAVAALALTARGVRRPVVRGVLLAAAAGGAFGIGSVFTKAVAADLAAGVPPARWPDRWPDLVAVAALAAAGLLLSQAAYRGAGLAAPLATVTVVNPVAAAAVGVTLLGEQFRYGVTGTVLALGCGVVAAGGLVLLSAVPPPSQPDAAGSQVGERVDVGAVPRPRAHLEVEVRPGAVAGRP